MDTLLEVLEKASDKEIISLCKLLWPKELKEAEIKNLNKLAEALGLNKEPEKTKEELRKKIYEKIYDQFRWLSSSIWGYLFKSKSYEDIVKELAGKLEIPKNGSVAEIESNICQKVLKLIEENMTPEQRKKIDEEIERAVKKLGFKGSLNKKAIIAAGGYFAFLTTAQLSGFGIYLLSTTLLGMVSHAIGITLPFVVYTSLTKAISLIIGPAGWIIGGLIFLTNLLKQPEYEILIPAIAYIRLLREKYFGEAARKRNLLKIVFWVVVISGIIGGIVYIIYNLLLK